MNKYFLLTLTIDNDEAVYNGVEFAIFNDINLCNSEINNLVSNSVYTLADLDIKEISSNVQPEDNKIRIYHKFDGECITSTETYIGTESDLKEMFEKDYNYYSKLKDTEIHYKSDNSAELWACNFVMKLGISNLNMNGFIEY